MKHRNFVLVDLRNPKERALTPEFLQHLQKAVLYSLEERQLLTADQRENCILELELQSRPKTVGILDKR